jgi:phage terminase large subunit GpA-like protein
MTYLFPAEIEAIKPPPAMSVRAWVEAHRVLPRGSAEPGPKRISRTPAVAIVYDWFEDYTIREATIQKPAQCGLTDAIVDLILWISENDPAPTALFLADEKTAAKLMKFRIKPALEALGKVRISSDNRDKDLTKFECTLTNGFYLVVSWGSSVAQTASTSYKYVFADEINKGGYDVAKDEGNTLGRIRERMETYPDSKFFKFSTPTLDDGRVTKELQSADVVYDFCVPCKDCGAMQPLNFDGVVWDGGSKATRHQIEETARYKCRECGSLWTNIEKNAALERGQFLPRSVVEKPRHVALQIHRLGSLFKGGKLAEMISRWIKANDEGPSELQNVVNSIFGEPWIPRISASQGDAQAQVAACRNGLAQLQLPEDTAALVAAIDVQMQGFWYCIRAVCSDGATHNIDHGYLNSWEEVDNIVFDRQIQGRKIWRCLIDTGGGKDEGAHISRTEEVYLWLRANAGRGVQIFGTKGSSRSMATKIRIGAPIEKTPSGKPIPGGLRIVQINTDVLKDALWFKIERTNESPELPGNWWIHRDTEQGYLKQICAEEKRRDRKGGTSWHRTNKDNHYLDIETLILAAVDPEFWGGIRAVTRGNHRKPAAASQASKPANMQRRPNPYTEGL